MIPIRRGQDGQNAFVQRSFFFIAVGADAFFLPTPFIVCFLDQNIHYSRLGQEDSKIYYSLNYKGQTDLNVDTKYFMQYL